MTSQTKRLFNYLSARRGSWVPMPRLARLCRSYNINSRVAEARKRYGVNITNETKPGPDGRKNSKYMLV